MKRHHSRFGGPRGGVSRKLLKMRFGSIKATMMLPRILATVKHGNQHGRDRFQALVEEFGLVAKLVQDEGWVAVYDVCGEQDGLSLLIADGCVNNWEYAISCRVPYRGTGASKAK